MGKNPLEDFLTVLAGALETESKSAENRRKEEERGEQETNIFTATFSSDFTRVGHSSAYDKYYPTHDTGIYDLFMRRHPRSERYLSSSLPTIQQIAMPVFVQNNTEILSSLPNLRSPKSANEFILTSPVHSRRPRASRNTVLLSSTTSRTILWLSLS